MVEFLNSREKAVVIWGVIVLAVVLGKDRSIVLSFLPVLRSMFAPKLTLVWVLAATYTGLLVLAGRATGLWQTTATKETLYWFFGAAVVLAGNAIVSRSFDGDYVKQIARKALRLTIIVEFLVNLYVMPLAVELVLVPLIALFVTMQVVSERDPSLAATKKVLDRVLMLIGFGLIAWVLLSASTDLHGLVTREHTEGLLIAPAFTLAFVPFLYALWRWRRWDQERGMGRWREEKLAA